MKIPSGKMDCLKSYKRSLILVLTPLLLVPLLPLYKEIGLTQRACNCLYMLLLMAVYWCTESLPLGLTALIPLALAPTMGILEAATVSKIYFKDIIVLMFASMIVALAIQQSGLHRRIALTFIKIFGIKPQFLMLGFMVPTWLLSMWISNTATSLMMVSILNCVITKLSEQETFNLSVMQDSNQNGSSGDKPSSSVEDADIESSQQSQHHEKSESLNRFEPTAKCLSLAVCYSATCGGVATLTGTGTNLIFYDMITDLGEKLNYNFNITLLRWMGFALPLSAILLLVCWIWLQVLFLGIRRSTDMTPEDQAKVSQVINTEYATLGKLSWMEGVTLGHFLVLVILWLARDPGKAGGWGQLFPKKFVTDGTTAVFVMFSISLFPKYPPRLFFPKKGKPFESLISWKTALSSVSWNVILLLGGGLALAECVYKSGLSEAIGVSLYSISGLPPAAIVLIICIATASLTEFAGNIVIATLMIPIVGDIAIRMSMNPLYFIIPCCIAASFAFMLPVATPPNAIVYSSGVLKISDMIKAGAVLNILSLAAVMLATMTWAPHIFRYNNYNASMISFSETVSNSTL